MSARRALITLGAVAALEFALLLPAPGAGAATCWYGSCFAYVSGQQDVTATGASVTMTQATPRVGGGHSLQELALRTHDRSAIVEIGWTVDPAVNGDHAPHLFVYHWVNNRTSCYNACGFVPYDGGVRAGQEVASGVTATFGIRRYDGDWWVSYNDRPVGYFPGSLWGGRFTAADNVSAFGEVADADRSSCNTMGNGRFGSGAGASAISDYRLIAAAVPHFSVSATDPGAYDAGHVTATSFTLGGPGAC